jgi:hypothetical protein
MFNRCLLLISILIFSACAGSKTTVIETKSKVETVTEITEKKLDTTVFIPAEKASLFIPIKEIEKAKSKSSEQPKVFTQENGRAKVTVKIDSSGVTATSNCDSIAQRLQFYEKLFKELKKEDTDTKTKVKEKTGYNLLQLILYMLATAIVTAVSVYFLKTLKII